MDFKNGYSKIVDVIFPVNFDNVEYLWRKNYGKKIYNRN